MRYSNVVRASFAERLNRFEAYVDLDGVRTLVHVKNTGRCRELLLPSSTVILEKASNPARKTAYDLVAVYKEGFGLINMDSQAPNKVVAEWLSNQGYSYIKPEYTYGSSRIDFYMEKDGEKYLMEVKGCTLEVDGVGYFPDAPTQRGVKHLEELIKAAMEGYHASIAFVIQMKGIEKVYPNRAMQPEFGEAMDRARAAGVKVLGLCCEVEEDGMSIIKCVEI